jgi:hypothetical protein
MKIILSLRWQRELYDWYLTKHITPVVVESENYMTSPEFVRKLCEVVGLDPEAAIFKWDRLGEEERAKLDPQVVQMMKTLFDSEGLRPDLAIKEQLVVTEEMEKWKADLGEDVAGVVREVVDASMDDYPYLKARKLTL